MIDKYFPVLDYGFIALKDYMGGDDSIVQAARVSYGAGTKKRSNDRGLIRYLMRHSHTTPLEMVEFKFHIGMPIFVARQWIRHRTANVNEYSGRYSVMPSLYYTPKKENLKKQSASNKQGQSVNELENDEYQSIVTNLETQRKDTTDLYKHMLNQDIARELCRIDLPLSTYTYWYWKCDLHNIFNFLRLRLDTHAQWEIRIYADKMAGMVKEICPLAWEAFEDYMLYGVSYSREERKIISDMIATSELGSFIYDIEKFIHDRKYNLSNREIKDFAQKFDTNTKKIDFSLNLADAKDSSYFEKLIEENS